jgi:hydrogenase nickel incorporation protein HypA/HybF
MHELAITQSIVEIVEEEAGQSRVNRVTLEIGLLSGVMPDAVRFCFDVCTKGTVLEGAQLEILEKPGLGRCRDCGRTQPMDALIGECDCGSFDIECVAGDELLIKEMEVA